MRELCRTQRVYSEVLAPQVALPTRLIRTNNIKKRNKGGKTQKEFEGYKKIEVINMGKYDLENWKNRKRGGVY